MDTKLVVSIKTGEITERLLTPEENAQREIDEQAWGNRPLPLDQQLDAILNTLPMEIQIQFAPVIAAGKVFIDTNRLDRLQALIGSTTVPVELEGVKQQMLAVLNG